MSFLSGKQAFLQILKDEGVDTMFGNPGTTELPLMDGLVREPSIRYVLALQEAVAISMADGYAQATSWAWSTSTPRPASAMRWGCSTTPTKRGRRSW